MWFPCKAVISKMDKNLFYSEIQFMHTIFNKLGYPKHLVDQVFSATRNKFYNPPPPLDIEEASATLLLP